jgi:hypothetical protein
VFINNNAKDAEAIYGVNNNIVNCTFKNNTNALYDYSDEPVHSNDLLSTGYTWNFDVNHPENADGLNNASGLNTSSDNSSPNSNADSENTGNPIALLLIALVIVVFDSRKFKK